MTGPWLASYLLLWALILTTLFLVIGTLQQLGAVRSSLGLRKEDPSTEATALIPPSVVDEGPNIGSEIPIMSYTPMNDIPADSPNRSGITLLVFMSPLCDTCQHVADPLNRLIASRSDVSVTVILTGIREAVRPFISLFPMNAPIIHDPDRTIFYEFNIRSNPFCLLYDAEGRLRRKAILREPEMMLEILANDRNAVQEESIYPAILKGGDVRREATQRSITLTS